MIDLFCLTLGDESETATEGEDEIRARELRKQEVHLKVPERPQGRQDTDSGSDTEVKTHIIHKIHKNKNCVVQ
jgi:hypothetical protein